MNRRPLLAKLLAMLLLAASAGMVHAQETKLVNCRSLEAAGNFIGPEEVLDGDRVCKKAKPGDVEPAKPEPAKSAQVTSSVVPANPTTGVAEAARANAAAKAEARKTSVPDKTVADKPVTDSAPQPSAPVAETKPAPVPEPAKNSPEPVASPATAPVVTEPVAETAAPAAENHGSARAEEAEPPAFGSANAPVTAKPKTNIARNTEVATAAPAPAPPVRVHRDAPVAAGTPSEAPEKDYGFSDANALAPVKSAAPAAQKAAQNSGQSVKTGGFDKSEANTAAAVSQNSACAKNITLGSLRDDKFTVGAPAWAEKWIAKNQNRMGNVCFSGAPVQGVRNYLIVFYTAPGNRPGGSAALPLPDASSGTGVFTAKDGSAWSYASKSAASTAADGSSPAQIWYATAYTEEGAPVAERWPDSAKRADAESTSEDLLNVVVDDLRKL